MNENHTFTHVPSQVPSLAIGSQMLDEKEPDRVSPRHEIPLPIRAQKQKKSELHVPDEMNALLSVVPMKKSQDGTGKPTYTKKRRAVNVTKGGIENSPRILNEGSEGLEQQVHVLPGSPPQHGHTDNDAQYVVQVSTLLSDNNEMALLEQQMNRLLNENNEEFRAPAKGKRRVRTKQPDPSDAPVTRRKRKALPNAEDTTELQEIPTTALRDPLSAREHASLGADFEHAMQVDEEVLPQTAPPTRRKPIRKKIRFEDDELSTTSHQPILENSLTVEPTTPSQNVPSTTASSAKPAITRAISHTQVQNAAPRAQIPKVASLDSLKPKSTKLKNDSSSALNVPTFFPGGAQESITVPFPALSLQLILYIKTTEQTAAKKSSSANNVQVFLCIKNMARHLIEIKVTNLEKKHVEMLNQVNGKIAASTDAPKANVFTPSIIVESGDSAQKAKSSWREIEFAPTEQKVIYIQQSSGTSSSTKKESPKHSAAALKELDEMLRLVAQGMEDPSALLPVLLSSLKLKVKVVQSKRLSRYCQHLNAHAIMQKTPYTDKVFPPKNRSISGNADTTYETKWMRPKDLLRNQQVSLFSATEEDSTETVHISHIYQGKLGNCYLLSALGALTKHHPNLIHKLFTTRTYNKYGIYEMRICFCGEWKKVQVDDFIPVNDDANRAKYVHTHHPVIWPAILEKGYAKLYGSFLTLKRGKSENAMTDLTGMPSKRIEFRHFSKEVKSGQFFDKIRKYSEKRYPMCTSTIAPMDKSKTGLGQGHAYTLLMARAYTDPDTGQEYRLVCLRDPRGFTSSKLPFNPRDPIWTSNPDLRFHYYIDSTHETEFWMSYEDYVRYFNRMSVCLVKDWKEKRARILCMGGHTNSFLLNTTEPKTAIYLTLHQVDKRVKGARDYVPVCAVVTNSLGTKYLFDTNFERKRMVRHEKVILEKADIYTIIPLTTTKESRSVVLSIHSEKDFKLSPEKYALSRTVSIPQLMVQALLMHGTVRRTKKVGGCTVQLWRKKHNRDVTFGFKLQKLGKKVSYVDVEYRVHLKGTDVVCGSEYGVVTLSEQNDFVFIIRFCANSSGTTNYHVLWTERGKLRQEEEETKGATKTHGSKKKSASGSRKKSGKGGSSSKSGSKKTAAS